MIGFLKHSRVAAVAISVIGFLTMGAAPAFANSSAAAADMTAATRDFKTSPISGGDQQFHKLFASWQALDDGDPSAPAATSQVGIPSQMPLTSSTLTSSYGMRTHPILGGRRKHDGIDLAAPVGTPVFATADGVVSRADRFSSYGLFIQIEHGAELETRFAHLSRLAVAAGEHVSKGDVIGYVGTTGRSTGPHLHYEIRVDGVPVNPMPYMAESDAQHAFELAIGEVGQGGAD